MTKKEKRRKWHTENKPIVFDYFDGVCQLCHKQINEKWDVHHLHYHYDKLYETSAKELIENKVITLVCRTCHDKEHTVKDIDNPQHLENKYYCSNCGRLERGIFDRKRAERLDKLLCRACYLNDKNGVTQMAMFT